jgi:hypothetical protein
MENAKIAQIWSRPACSFMEVVVSLTLGGYRRTGWNAAIVL